MNEHDLELINMNNLLFSFCYLTLFIIQLLIMQQNGHKKCMNHFSTISCTGYIS